MLANWVQETTATTGTGTITLGGAYDASFLAVSDRFSDGDLVEYTIKDGNNREIGIGTYTVSGNTLARTKIIETLVSGVLDTTSPTAISLSGSAIIGISGTAEDYFPKLIPYVGSNKYYPGDFSALDYNDSITWALNRCAYFPIMISSRKTVSGLSIYVTTADGGAPTCIAGIYDMDDAGLPKTLLDSVAFDVTTTGQKTVSFSANLELPPGMYVSVIAAASATVAFKGAYGHTKPLAWWPYGSDASNSFRKYAPFEVLSGGWSALPATPAPVMSNLTQIIMVGLILV